MKIKTKNENEKKRKKKEKKKKRKKKKKKRKMKNEKKKSFDRICEEVGLKNQITKNRTEWLNEQNIFVKKKQKNKMNRKISDRIN